MWYTHIHAGRPIHTNKINKFKNKWQRNTKIKCHHRSNEPNRYLQSILPKHYRKLTFFPATDGIFSKTDHILECKQVSLNAETWK